MSAGQVPHVGEAISYADAYSWGDESRAADRAIAHAQVHATLALAEQQRIANIIALASLRIGPNDTPALRHLAIEPHGLDSVRPAAVIREGLGLS